MFLGFWWDQIGSLFARTLLLAAVLLQLFFVLPSQSALQQTVETEGKAAMQLSRLLLLEIRAEFADTKLSVEQQSVRFLGLINSAFPDLDGAAENSLDSLKEEITDFQEYLSKGAEQVVQTRQKVDELLDELDEARVASSRIETHFNGWFLLLFVTGSIFEVVCQAAASKRENK